MYEDNGKHWGGGLDGIGAEGIFGYSKILFSNIYIARIKAHFRCEHNIALDHQLQLAVRAINGLLVDTLSESEKEHAAKAIKCGYLYRDGDILYTKILVHNEKNDMFEITDKLSKGYFENEAYEIAEKLAVLIKKAVPDYLMGEWRFANTLASLPILDSLVEVLIEKGILVPPEDGIGAEGCWLSVE